MTSNSSLSGIFPTTNPSYHVKSLFSSSNLCEMRIPTSSFRLAKISDSVGQGKASISLHKFWRSSKEVSCFPAFEYWNADLPGKVCCSTTCLNLSYVFNACFLWVSHDFFASFDFASSLKVQNPFCEILVQIWSFISFSAFLFWMRVCSLSRICLSQCLLPLFVELPLFSTKFDSSFKASSPCHFSILATVLFCSAWT